VEGGDPKIICHPVVVLFSDILWSQLANRYFLLGRSYFLVTLMVFITSQSVLQHMSEGAETEGQRLATFICRVFIYVGSMGSLVKSQITNLKLDIQNKNFYAIGGLKVPEYLTSWRELGSLCLLLSLVFMITQEPILWCAGNMNGSFAGNGLFTTHCPEAASHKEAYAILSMVAMLLYWGLLTDLSILSTRISSFFLVCGRVLSEVGLFLGGVAFLIATFASSISALNHNSKEFEGIPAGALSLLEIALGMFPTEQFEHIQKEVTVLACVSLFIIITLVFLLNLLIAQLNGAYQAVYDDMVGYARLTRGQIIVTTIEAVSAKRWGRFLESLKFEESLEFNEGDIGLAGGIQVTEPSNANPTTVDMIKRFGGSTSPAMPWPEEEGTGDDDDDKFDRLEKVILRATKKMEGSGGSKKNAAGESSMGQSSASNDQKGSEGSDGGSE